VIHPGQPVATTPPQRRQLARPRHDHSSGSAGALGNVNPESLATGVCGLSAGIVDADVTYELGHSSSSFG
jgi:hypothetical protein